MTFTVTYRAKDGALSEVAVEAADRTECMADCKRRGIAPTRIREGTIRNDVAMSPRPCCRGEGILTPSRKVALVAALVIVAVVGGVWWWLAREPYFGETKLSTEKPLKQVTKPTRVEKPHSKSVVTNAVMAVGVKSEIAPGEKADGVDNKGATNKGTTVENKLVEAPSHAVQQHVSNNPADQILGMALTTPIGQAIPPIPYYKGLDKDFKLALETPIEDLATDDEQTRVLKATIRQARAEMKEFVDRGMTVQEVLEEYRKVHAENLEVRAGVIREARKIFDSGDIEGATEYVRKMNLALDQMNIPRIEMPHTPEEKRRLRAERGRETLARRARKEASQ